MTRSDGTADERRRVRPLLVMVSGATPGRGKSTLSRAVAEQLRGDGWRVDRFDEDDILDHPAFTQVMIAFRSRGVASLDQLLDATGAYVRGCLTAGADIVVQDMLLPYLPSLLAWGHDDDAIAEFFVALARACDSVDLVQLHLTGDPSTALSRAASREGAEFLDALVRKVAAYPGAALPVDDRSALERYFREAEERSLGLLRSTPWPVFVLDARAPQRDTAVDAVDAVRRFA